MNIADKKILVTGGNSMLGRSILDYLALQHSRLYSVCHEDTNLLDREETNQTIRIFQPNIIIHCAGYNGNISFNKEYPADIFYKTLQIGLNVLNAGARNGVECILSLISSCAYPDMGNRPLVEENFWQGEPNRSVDAHGFAKRGLLEFGRQIDKQYNIKCIGMVVNTCYGPYDNYDLNKTKVVGSFIKKFVDARNNDDKYVICWGTGQAKREFIYCEDVAKYIPLVIDSYHSSEYPINIGSGREYTIKELAEIVKDVVGYKGDILWDKSKPDGQMSKLLDNTKMKSLLSYNEFTPLEEGIRKTVEWYNENIQ